MTADIAKNDAMSFWDWTKGMQHSQAYDEVSSTSPRILMTRSASVERPSSI